MREIFVLIPSLHPAGPVKGAIALANALAVDRSVTLAHIKAGPGAEAAIDPAVKLLALYEAGSWGARTRKLAMALEQAGGRGRQESGAAMISFCLSADAMALQVRRHARWISSVRGNLPRNYRFDYGPLGVALAIAHLTSLRLSDRVVAMTEPMAAQIARYTGRDSKVIGNFVDEVPLEAFRRVPDPRAPYTFAFLGGLSPRKQPHVLLDAVRRLVAQGVKLKVDVMGAGPMLAALAETLQKDDLEKQVTLHGHVTSPYRLLARADALVLPSLSEGMSRAVLEAMQLGVPAVLRDVDGNRALVHEGRNGLLFARDADLASAMLEAAELRRKQAACDSLLPQEFRQGPCAQAFLDLVEAE